MLQIRDRLRSALRRRATYGYLGGIVVAVLLLLVISGGDTEEDPDTGLAAVDRGPGIPIVIPEQEPLVLGVSSALTGPIAERGTQYRDAVVVAVERWKADNGDTIGGHPISVVAEDDGCTESDVTTRAAERSMARRAEHWNVTVREAERRVVESIPIRRLNDPEDIAALAVFLASPAARNITGQALNVDGGIITS